MLHQPFGQQHHQNTLTAALGVPDHATLALDYARLGGLDAGVLVRPGHFLLTGIKDNEIADKLQQARLAAHLCQRPVQQCACGQLAGTSLVFPLDKKLFRCTGGAIAKPLRITAREHQLHGAEEALIEDRFLIGNKLAHPVSNLHRTALEFNYGNGDAVQIQHQIGAALMATLESDLFSQSEIIVLWVAPVNQMNRFVCLPHRHLHRHAVAQQIVGAKIGLIQRHTGYIGGGFQLLQGGGDMRVGVAALA